MDLASQGNWHGAYGSDGYSIAGSAGSVPPYASLTVRSGRDNLWAANTIDVRALQTADGTARLAGSWSSAKALSFDISLIDGHKHQLAMYAVDWDQRGRMEQVQVLDAATGAVLVMQDIADFAGGAYLIWNLSGNVRINVTGTAGPSVVLSGFFFDRTSTVRATANFVRLDADTGGNWRSAYGDEGHVIAGTEQTLPAYASFDAQSERLLRRESDSPDSRAIPAGGGFGKIASAWYDDPELNLELTVSDDTPHQVALYALDWDGLGRKEDLQILDAMTGVVLDSQTLAGFDRGVYLVWAITGQVRIKVSRTAGPNAVLSAVFFGDKAPAASQAMFLRADSTTRGNWRGVYGAEGFELANRRGKAPACGVVTIGKSAAHTWEAATEDPRALQFGFGEDRIASAWYSESETSLEIDVNLIDGKRHQVAIYVLDWDGQGIAEQVQILDPATEAVLDTQYVSNASSGVYLVWWLAGIVKIRVAALSGSNAAISGVFLGGDGSVRSSATFLHVDKGTRGDWQTGYGTDGYATASGAQKLPAYARLVGVNQPGITWRAAASDQGALRALTGPGRIGASWSGNPGLSFELNLTDNQPHQFAFYALDFDHQQRSQVVQILDADTDTILDSRAMTAFAKGSYLVWVLSGHVKINVTGTTGASAVVAGVFFGGSNTINSTAAFVQLDAVTQGNWQGVYGSAGYVIPGLTEKLPSDASFAAQNQQTLTRRAKPDDGRSLVSGSGSTRTASAWYNSPELDLDVNITSGTRRQVALYAVDWDRLGREEVVQIRDAGTSKVLDTRVLSRFAAGAYLVWTISGHVRITITRTAGPNAVVSGLFFDGNDVNRGKPSATASSPSVLPGPHRRP
jgi:hypothetical protein